MPSEFMDQRRVLSLYAPSGSVSDEVHMPVQRHMGFLKTESMPVHHGTEGLPSLFRNKSLSSPPPEKSHSINTSSSENFPSHQALYFEKQKIKLRNECLADAGRTTGFPVTSWVATETNLSSSPHLSVHSGSLNANTRKAESNGIFREDALFLSSLPDILNKKLTMSSNSTLIDHPMDKVGSFIEDEPFGSLEAKEIEALTIGNLLPDDEDLLSGVIDGIEGSTHSNHWNDAEEDIFLSGGGMELEANERQNYDKHANLTNGILTNRNWEPNNSFNGEKSYSTDLSRTLLVRNVPSNIEDAELRLLFEHYGDVHTMHTACKNRGFIMISYYDLRSACSAVSALQNKLLRNKKLDIHFSIGKENLLDKESIQGRLAVFNLDPLISSEKIHQIFGAYGDIKQIHEHQTYRVVEFYDVRAAEAAFHALNMSDIAGQRIEIVASFCGTVRQRSMMQQWPYGFENVDANGLNPQGVLLTDSPSGCTGTMSAGLVLNNGFSSGNKQGQHAVPQSPISPFLENAFDGYSYGATHYLSSTAGIASSRNHHGQSGFAEHSHSLGHIGFDSMREFHPHSHPEHHEALINGMPYNSPNTMSGIGINIGRHPEGMDNIHASRVSSGSLSSMSFGRNERAFGALGNGSNGIHGHGPQHSWKSSHKNQLQSPLMWPDTSFINIPTHSSSQLQGLSRAHSHMLNSVGALHQHHVGSAPTLNPSIWERRHMYSADMAEASAFHPGSVESIGFSGSSNLHPMEFSSPNIFPHVRGNFAEPLISSPQIGLPSPQQKFHIFHGRNSAISSIPSAFETSGDRVRSRRGDANSNQVDNKRQYELDIDRIMRGEDNRTTLMIKNIPNKYTSKMLLAAIDENHRGTYDFIYLPIDFKNKCNVGYAFINMIEAQQIIPFYKTFNGKKWEKFNSEKVASLAYARIQGRAALIAHFQNSSLMNEDKRCRPILFHADGPNAGDQEPFPMGSNIRSRPGRSKACSSEDNHQGSPSSSTDGEDTSTGLDSSGSRKE